MADALAQLEEEILRKREAAADEPADAARDAKRGRVERAAAATRETVNRTLQAADQRGEVEEDALDERSLKHLVLAFEKRVTENVKMRAKFGDQPSKFLDSEIELYAELHKFRVLGTSPELLPTFVSAGCLPTVLGLLAHENLDIVIGVIELLAELTDSDLLTDLPELEQANVLISALVENSAFDVLVDCLGRLNETVAEESEAVHKTLGIIENMLESDPSKLAPLVVAKTAFMPWLLRRVKERAFDANRLYATELLSILLQSQPENQKRLAELDGVDVLLLAASAYKRKDPPTSEEAELAENVYDCLCSALLLPSNQTVFLRAEGIELMVLTLRENRYAARCALKALDFALQRNAVCCERFVEVSGFPALFPFVGGQRHLTTEHVKSKKEKTALEKEDDEHLMSVLCTLCHELTGTPRQRLLGKFVERDGEKVRAVVRVRGKYADRVDDFEEAFENMAARNERQGLDPPDEEERFLGRLDAGEFTVQLSSAVIGYLLTSGDAGLSRHTLSEMHAQGVAFADVVRTLEEHRTSMGEESADATVTNNRRKVEQLHARVSSLYNRMAQRGAAQAAPAAAGSSPS